jgi:hypothetical protein
MGCSLFKSRKERKKEQIAKALEEYPDLLRQDTVRFKDTVRIETVKVDTAFKETTDTVIIEKDKLKIRYVNKNDTVFLEGECEGDTIYIDKPVPVKCPPVVETNKISWWTWVIICTMAITTLLVSLRKR